MKCTQKDCYIHLGIGCSMGEPKPENCKYAEVEAKQSTFNIGDEITAKFKNFLGEELTVKGNIREILTGVLCCNDVISGRSFAVNFDEVLSHTSCLIEVGQALKGNVSNGSE